MNVQLNLEELDLIIEALDDMHKSYSQNIDYLSKLHRVNGLYNRLIELSEEHERDLSLDVEKMKDNSEPEEDRGMETDYSAEEAEQMGAFVALKMWYEY